MFLCRQRGINPEQAVSMIVNGFCKEVFKELPLFLIHEVTASSVGSAYPRIYVDAARHSQMTLVEEYISSGSEPVMVNTVTEFFLADRLPPEVTQKLGFQSDAIVFEPLEDGKISDQQCWDAMRLVYDPEIPVNVVGLGLIYKLDINQDKHFVFVEMTLTSAGCGMGAIIAGDVKDKLLQVPNVKDGKVDVVFDPPWSYDNLEEEARLELGLI